MNGHVSLEIVLTEIRQLRSDFNNDLLNIRNDLKDSNVKISDNCFECHKPTNRELEIKVDGLSDSVEVLKTEVAGFNVFKDYAVIIAMVIGMAFTFVSRNLEMIIKWFQK